MRSKTALFLAILFGVISITYSTRLGGQQNGLVTNMISLIPPFLAFVFAFRAAHTYDFANKHGKALLLMAVGLLFWFIGEASFFLFQFIVDINPFPSVADLCYIAGYFLIWAGLGLEIKANNSSLKSLNQYIQFLIALIMAMLALAVLYFGVYLAYAPGQPLLNNLVAMGYGLGDLVLIAPTLYVLKIAVDYRGGKLFLPWALILIALLLNLLGDVYFAIYRDAYTLLEWPHTMVDIVWGLSYILFAYSFYSTASHVREARASFKK